MHVCVHYRMIFPNLSVMFICANVTELCLSHLSQCNVSVLHNSVSRYMAKLRDWNLLRTGHMNDILMMDDSCSFQLMKII